MIVKSAGPARSAFSAADESPSSENGAGEKRGWGEEAPEFVKDHRQVRVAASCATKALRYVDSGPPQLHHLSPEVAVEPWDIIDESANPIRRGGSSEEDPRR